MKLCSAMRGLVILAVVCLFPVNASAQVPDRGLRAEMAGEWEQALEVYREVLEKDPRRRELWLRSADILSHLERPHEAARALEQAARLDPKDSALQLRLARAHAGAGNPEKALEACLRASDLDPRNPEILKTCALQAAWAGETETARAFYDRLLELDPSDSQALLGRARARSWSGELNQAVRDYGAYLDRKPREREVWLELAEAQMWRGNYPAAEEVLDTYDSRFGEDEPVLRSRASLLARSGRPRASLKLMETLEGQSDLDIQFARVLALNADGRPGEALSVLQELEERHPDLPEIAGLSKFVRTPLRSRIALGGSWYRDSDDIRIQGIDLEGTWVVSPETELFLGAMWEKLEADAGSGLERRDGRERIENERGWVGFRHRFGAFAGVEGKAGAGAIEDGDGFLLYEAALELTPHDRWTLEFRREQDLYALSPRAVSEEVIRRSNRLELEWRPDSRHVIVAEGAWDTFSDDNRRWEAVFAPRRVVLRTDSFNLDLGLSTWWFGFDKDMDHGYYDPGTYQRHAVTAFGYWKMAENHGIGMSAALGVQKDEDMSGFRFGEDVTADGYFGIYRDWMLRVSLGYADRDQEGGSFDGASARVVLTRRF